MYVCEKDASILNLMQNLGGGKLMSKSTHNIFRFHEEDFTRVIEAASISEARRKYKQETGEFPHKDMQIESEPVR